MNEEPILILKSIESITASIAQARSGLGMRVAMGYFAGMRESEIADAPAITDRAVRRDRRKARAFLVPRSTTPLAGGRGD